MKLFLILLLLIPSIIFSQTRFVMSNGQRYVAYVTESSNDELELELINKTRVTIKKDQINSFEDFYVKIKFINGMLLNGHISKVTKDSIFGRNEDYLPFAYSKKNILIIDDDDIDIYDQKYSFLGGSALVPGAINFIYGMHLNKTLGYRISAGIFPNAIIGLQTDLLFNLSKRKDFEHNIGLNFGLVSDPGEWRTTDEIFTYFGPSYDLNWYGFHFQIGISVLTSQDEAATLTLTPSIGYVYRFYK
jgi:hypothetical protein